MLPGTENLPPACMVVGTALVQEFEFIDLLGPVAIKMFQLLRGSLQATIPPAAYKNPKQCPRRPSLNLQAAVAPGQAP